MPYSPESQPLPGVERIAVLRSNGIGDAVFALPALWALRAAYPRARIVLLGAPHHRMLFADRPSPVDEVVVVPPSRGVRGDEGVAEDPAELEAFFAAMRDARFDLALQMHGGGRWSNPFLLRLGARHTAGMRTGDAARLDREMPYVYYQHEVMRLLELVTLVGAPLLPPVPRLEVTERDRSVARRLLAGLARPVLVHPSATDSRRRWPAESFAGLLDELSSRGFQPVLVGGPDSAELSARIAALSLADARDLTGRVPLADFIGLTAEAELLVSNDSGPLHVAGAVGATTVGIYWCGNMINAQLALRTRHRPLISWRLTCPVCGVDCTRSACGHGESFVADVRIEEVMGACLELLVAG